MDKLLSLLVLLVFLTNEILVMLGLACFLVNGRIFFAIIAMFCLHFYAVETARGFKRLIQDKEEDNNV